jgi:hypothetical protein
VRRPSSGEHQTGPASDSTIYPVNTQGPDILTNLDAGVKRLLEDFSGTGLVIGLLRSTLGSEANSGLLIRRRSSSLQSTVVKH